MSVASPPSWTRYVELIASVNSMDMSEIDGGMRFVEDLAFDSLMLVELVVAIEQTFKIRASDAELETRSWNGLTVQHLYEDCRLTER